MGTGWAARRRLHRAATALVALTLLPVAVLVATQHSPSPAVPTLSGRGLLTAQDIDTPAVEALQRSQASGLFAPFSWNGQTVAGPFVTFDFVPSSGTVVGLFGVSGTQTELLVNTIEIVGFSMTTTPQVGGSTFVATGLGVTLVAHDEPTGLIEVQTTSMPRTVKIAFPDTATDLEVSQGTTWPRASVSFTIGNTTGRMIVGSGSVDLNGTTVTAQLKTSDYLALRSVPSFIEHAADRAAVLDAFASGRLAAEYDLVAMTNGQWLENVARFRPSLSMLGTGVGFGDASITLSGSGSRDGVLVLAFDPRTMPADSGHKLVVTLDGATVPETTSPLEALYTSPSSSGQASFSRLAMNATVLVLYLPSLTGSSIEVESIALPVPGLDMPTELAMVAAVLVVSVAAAAMFRRREE